MKTRIKKIFGGLEMTWRKVILISIILDTVVVNKLGERPITPPDNTQYEQ